MRRALGVWMGSMLLAMAVSGQADPAVEDVERTTDAGSMEAKATQVAVPLIQLVTQEFICSRFTSQLGGQICHAWVDRERNIQVFRNGRAVAVTTERFFDDEETPIAGPVRSTIRDGFAPAAARAALNAVLGETKIGTRRGQCIPAAWNGSPFLFRNTSTITWFGPDRTNTATFGSSTANRTCAPELLEAYEAIVAFGETIQ